MDEHGPAVSYLTLRRGTRVIAGDGVTVGRVRRVLAAQAQDVFHGILLDGPSGDRVIGAEQVASIHERAVILHLSAAECRELPPASSDPAARPGTPLQALDDLVVKLWRRVSTFR
ncbi:MAG TPA: hypothetical protein VIJ51_11095 [Solirubrobacteraceae bacterium]